MVVRGDGSIMGIVLKFQKVKAHHLNSNEIFRLSAQNGRQNYNYKNIRHLAGYFFLGDFI